MKIQDPLLKFFESHKIPYWVSSLIMLVGTALLSFVIAPLTGHWRTHFGVVGVIDDPGQLIIDFVVQPLMVGYYFWMPSGIIDVFQNLKENRVIRQEDFPRYSKFLLSVQEIFNHRLGFIFSTIMGLIFTGTIIYENLTLPQALWMHVIRWPYYLIEIPKTFFTVLSFLQIAIRVVIFQWALSKLHRNFQIQVHPMHPDDAGGLLPISELIRTYTYWIFAAVAFVASVGLGRYFRFGILPSYTKIELFLLPVFTASAFFLPLLGSHNAMKNCRKRDFTNISLKFDKKWAEIVKSPTLNNNNIKSVQEALSTFERVRQEYPTWPFNAGVLRRFGFTIAASLLPFLFSIAQDVLLNLFVKFPK